MTTKMRMKILGFGVLHFLVAFPAIITVAALTGFSLSTTFLLAGVATLAFHVITKGKLPSVLGISGAYIGVIIGIRETFPDQPGILAGAVISAALVYFALGVLFYFKKEMLYKILPQYVLNMAIALIGLSLLPVALDIITTSAAPMMLPLIVILAIAVFFKSRRFGSIAMAMGLAVGVLLGFVYGIEPVQYETALAFIPFSEIEFNFAACFPMMLVALVTIGECLGDCQNVSNAVGIDVREEPGVHRVLFGNAFAQVLSGTFGGPVLTTYSENVAFVRTSGFKSPKAQQIAAVLFIIVGFTSDYLPILSFINIIPMAAFGAVLLFLYGLLVINAFSNISAEGAFNCPDKVFVMGVILSLSYLSLTALGVNFNGLSIAFITGIVLNFIYVKRQG